jgi:molybdopterin/thiamine biosynthesis adenylyltransferase
MYNCQILLDAKSLNKFLEINYYFQMKKPNVLRHARHIMLKEIGGHGQKLIANSSVAIVGMGGLGAPCSLYLAAAGIGKLILIDDDDVELSNLQRQIIYQTKHVGIAKTQAAKNALLGLDPDIEILTQQTRLTPENAAEILANADIIIDGTDNFETRFIVNSAAFKLNKILISGALGRFDGQVCAFDFRSGRGPCYQCFVPQPPPRAETCAQLGVVGALAGIIGTIMALEAVKIITSAGNSLIGRILLYDGLEATSRTIRLLPDENCKTCS